MRPTMAAGGPLRLVVALVAMLGLLVGPVLPRQDAGAATPRIDLPLERYALPNGLEVILAPDHRLPTVSTNIWYHVGAADEGPTGSGRSRTGFAHLFEHMMFQGSGHVPEGRYDAIIEGAGGDFNASTHFDYTNYYISDLPSDRLETALWLESDRMGFLLDRLDQGSLSNQQAVVRNERRQNWEQRPYALTYGEVFHQLFPEEHPYHGAVIGSHEDIQAAELADVREFFKTYYVPNNATLVVAGNFAAAPVKKWIAKYFGSLPAGREPPEPEITVPRIAAEKRVVLTDEVELEKVTMAWLTPAFFTEGDAVADITASILGEGGSSRLHQRLVRDLKIAQEVSAYQASAAHPSVFFIEALAKPGRSAKELEEAIDEELGAQARSGPAKADLVVAKTGFAAHLISAMESVGERADLINTFNHFTGRADHLNAYIRSHDAVDRGSVQRFVREQLRRDGRVVIHTVPGRRVLPPDPPAPEAPAPGGALPPAKQPWRNKAPGAGPAPTVVVPPVRRFSLDNGLPVYLAESHTLPVVTASLVSRYGSAADPVARPGLAGFTAGMLRRGTKGMTAEAIARGAAALGGTLDAGADRNGSAVSITTLTPQARKALNLVAAVVRRPTFPRDEIARQRDDLSVALRSQSTDPRATASARLASAVYGVGHPYGHLPIGTAAGVGAVRRADLVGFHGRAFTPATTALLLAGDLTERQARAMAERSFGSWRGTGDAPPVPGAGRAAAERVVLVDMPGAAQTFLDIGQAGLPRSHPDFEPLRLANQVLGGQGLSSRLMLNLREKRGWTYGAGSTLASGTGPAPFDVRAAVQTPHTGPAVREILAEIRRLRGRDVSAAELRAAKAAVVGSASALFQTTALSVRAARDMFLYDLPGGYYSDLRGLLAPLTVDQVRAAAARHLRAKTMRIVAVGDRATVEQQLRRLDLGTIVHRKPDGARAGR